MREYGKLAFEGMEQPEDLWARVEAHQAFDAIWKDGHASRGAAYAWLREVTGLPRRQCHMRQMDEAMCREVIRLVEEKGPGTPFWERWHRPRRRR